MSDWSAGYVVDLEYTHGFYKEMSPAHLAHMCLAWGLRAPEAGADGLAYCELGCGRGATANLLAAANPSILFHATDFNPAHIAEARDLASAAGTRNLSFYEDSFADFRRRRDLPDFDFIALHGVLSWVSAENRREIAAFIRERLRPGGIVYVSYNALPGWAHILPLRALMAESAAASGGDLLKGAESGLDFLDRLAQTEPHYFKAHPGLGERLKDIRAKNRNYVVHEYLNREFKPFSFSELAGEMREAKLAWACPADALSGADELQLSPEQAAFLKSIPDLNLRQSTRDVMLNLQFRRDIFIKGPTRLSPSLARKRWMEQRFVLPLEQGQPLPKIVGQRGTIDINADLGRALLEAFGSGATSLGEATRRESLAKLPPMELMRGLNYLVGQGACHPCPPPEGEAKRIESARRFNAAAREQARFGPGLSHLASPVTGSGAPVERLWQLVQRAEIEGAPDIPARVFAMLDEAGERLMKEGRRLMEKEENLEEIRAAMALYREKAERSLRILGVVEADKADGADAMRLSA